MGTTARIEQTTADPLIGIVDDDEPVRDSIGSLVRSVGFRAALFPSAEIFLRSDQIVKTNCLILDINMPGVNGLQLQQMLRSAGCSIPIIFATVCTDEAQRTLAFRQGAIAYLSKPFSDDALLGAMEAALKSRAASKPS